jgi:hypothetical protein
MTITAEPIGPIIPLHQIRSAVTTLVAGLIHHEVISHEVWDVAVTTLGRSHEQIGGTTRRLLYATLAASHPDAPPDILRRHLTALARTLNVPTAGGTGAQLQLFQSRPEPTGKSGVDGQRPPEATT